MITINDEFPGPVIRVTEGSVVKVRVKIEVVLDENRFDKFKISTLD